MFKGFKFLIFTLVAFSFAKSSFALDPLLAEKKTPKNPYQKIEQKKEDLDCKLPDFKKSKINVYKVVNLAMCRSPELKSSWYGVKQQAAAYGASKSLYFPTVSIGANKRYGDGDMNDNWNFGANLDWLLFDFGKRGQNIDKQYFSMLSVGYQHSSTVTDFVYDVIKSYLNLYSAQEAVIAADTSLKAYEKAYKIAKEKYKVGVVPKSDVYNAETQFAQAQLTYYKAENAVLIERGNFNKLMNIPQGVEVKLEEPQFLKNVDEIEKSINVLIDEAVKNRSSVASIIAKERAYLAQYKAAKRDFLPSVSFSASASRVEYDKNDIPNNDGSSISFNVSIPIFSGFSKTYAASQARYAYEGARADRETIEKEVAYEVWTSYHYLKNSSQNYEASLALVKSSKQARDVALGMYRNGRGDLLNLLFLEASYSTALNERITTQYEKVLAQMALLRAIGYLNIQFLEENIGE